MEHKHAQHTLAVERYALGEMTDDERSDFEAHYFECPDCAADVRETTAFLDSGRELSRRLPRKVVRPAVRSWLPAAAAAALFGIGGYQMAAVNASRLAANAEIPTEIRLYEEQSRAEGGQVPTLAADRATILYVAIEEEGFASYRCEVRDASGKAIKVLPVSAEQARSPVPVLVRALPAGRYSVVIEGVREDGKRSPITTYQFTAPGQ